MAGQAKGGQSNLPAFLIFATFFSCQDTATPKLR
jgi:hypothetical protein